MSSAQPPVELKESDTPRSKRARKLSQKHLVVESEDAKLPPKRRRRFAQKWVDDATNTDGQQKPLEPKDAGPVPASEPIYCICQQINDPTKPMICCELCNNWFHLACVHLTIQEADALSSYECTICRQLKPMLAHHSQSLAPEVKSPLPAASEVSSNAHAELNSRSSGTHQESESILSAPVEATHPQTSPLSLPITS